MPPSDMTDIPPDLGSAIHMIGRLRAEVKRRPKLAVIKVDTPQDTLYADRLHVVQPDQKVTITLETDRYTFQFTAIPSPSGPLATFTPRG